MRPCDSIVKLLLAASVPLSAAGATIIMNDIDDYVSPREVTYTTTEKRAAFDNPRLSAAAPYICDYMCRMQKFITARF
jgi:hypothetical protein